MSLLFKLLRQNVSLMQLSGFLLVNLIGGVIVLFGVQAYVDFRTLSEKENKLMSSSCIVITKPVSVFSTAASALGGRQAFSKKEIEELDALASVASVGEFRTSRFEVYAQLNIAEGHRVGTDLFLDAVPDEFVEREFETIGLDLSQWSAGIDDDTIPMLLPRNYLNLYNYGFAASKGLPLLSDKLLSKFPMKLRVRTKSGYRYYNAKLCGLTTNINTILVPWNFINEANDNFAADEKMPSARLIIATDASKSDDSLLQYIDEQGYVIEGDSSHVRLQNFIYGLLFVVIGIGFTFSIVAFFMLVVSIMLLIEKNKEKIINLFSMGYPAKRIAAIYQLLSLGADVLVWVVAAVAATFIYPLFAELMADASPGFVSASLWGIWLVALLLALLFVTLHCIVIFVQVRKLCK